MHWKLLLLVFSHMGPRNRPSEPSLWAQSRPRVEFSKARMASIGAQKKSLLLKPWMRNTMKTCFLSSRQFLTLWAYPIHPLLKARHFGFFEIFFLDLACGLSWASNDTQDNYVGQHLFSGLCSSKIDWARASPAVGERDTMLLGVRAEKGLKWPDGKCFFLFAGKTSDN